MHRVGLIVIMLVGGAVLLDTAPVAVGQDDPEGPRAVGMLSTTGVSASVMQAARTAITGPDGVGKDGPLAAVGMELALLYHQHQLAGASGVQALREPAAPRSKAEESDGRVRGAQSQVHSPISANGRFVVVEAIAAESASRLFQELRRLGLEGGATAGNVVSGRLPISAIKQAAALPSLLGMMPSYARTHVGSARSEADSSHRVIETRETLGVGGNGQKVCVLSDSYNESTSAATTASEDIQSGDLPGAGNPLGNTTPVDVVEDSDTDETDEGRAMLQLIHDLAPEATLGFHTALGGLAAFSLGILELADVGCTVIVDDIRYNTEPFYQDGPVSNAVDDVVAQGVPYFSSAGNDGQNSYEASFRGAPGEPSVIDDTFVPHDFNPGGSVDTRQAITIQPGGTFQIFSFQWTDPSAQVEGSSGPDTDIDIALVDENGDIVTESTRSNVAVPVESLEYTNEESSEVTLDLVVEKAPADPAPDEIKYVYSGSGFAIEEYDTGGATIYGHPMAEGAMAVAAAPFFNTARYNPGIDSSAVLEYFSSRGGLQIRFDQNGDPLSTPISRQKPEVTGTDYVDNTFLGTDINIQDPDTFPNFPGTSAAAPNVAAIAALIRQSRPVLGPAAVYERLESAAVDVRFRQELQNGELITEPIAPGVDPWSGHGFVRADRAVPPPAGVRIANESVTTSTRQRSIEIAWTKVGTESVDAFVLEKQFYDGAFVEQERISAGGDTEFMRTLEDLPFGTHRFRISAVRNDSTLTRTTVQAVLRQEGVNVTTYPNPFSGPVNLSVTLPEAQDGEQNITVRVFDILGRHVATPLREGTINESGSTSFNLGPVRSLSSGVYFFRVQGANFEVTTKAVRVR